MQPSHASPPRRRDSSSSDPPLSPDIEPPRLRTASPAHIAAPSFATFRAQTPSVSTASSPVRRKPLPGSASPVATRFSSASLIASPKPPDRGHNQRAFSTDNTPLRVAESTFTPPLTATSEEFVPRNLDEAPHGNTPVVSPETPHEPLDDYIADEDDGHPRKQPARYEDTLSVGRGRRPGYARAASSYHTARASSQSEWDPQTDAPRTHSHSRTPTMSSYESQRTPNLTLQVHDEDGVTGDFLDYDQLTDDEASEAKLKSPPANKFTSFFGWKSGSQNLGDSPTTSLSEKSMSPSVLSNMKKIPKAVDVPAANADVQQASYFTVPGTPLYSSSTSVNAHVEELERELRDISSELARSILREMELEDELELSKSEAPLGISHAGQRTSDYYSDSGASSARFPNGDSEMKIEALEKLRRKAEQERAQAKVDTAQRLQDELRRRCDLEAQVQDLEEQLHEKGKAQVDSERVRELERRIADERTSKENFQDLLMALRQEHDQDRNERDNLRDEVIPDLQGRLEGLESEASRVQELTYENARLQQELESFQHEILPDLRSRLDQFKSEASQVEYLQEDNARLKEQLESAYNEANEAAGERIEKLQDEITRLKRELNSVQNEANIAEVAQLQASQLQSLGEENSRLQQEVQSLRNENQTLVNARRMTLELQQQSNRFNSIAEEAEEGATSQLPKIGLSRSNSLARNSVQLLRRGSRSGGTLSRSNSVKEKAEAPRDFGDRMKDVEEQRDALHRALKLLLARHDLQTKEHAKKIKLLETEKDRALNVSPRRTAFYKEVTNLREEINILRHRADDALDQKWQVEKNLGGLRMDLTRAELETSSLRDLLSEKDIFLPERRPSAASVYSDDSQAPISLDKAYRELQTIHALSLARVKDMEAEESQGEASEEAEHVMELLKQSISDAEAERDHAHKEAEAYRQQARALQESEVGNLAQEQSLAAQLFAAATRMDELASQVQYQLQQNNALKERLAEAIGRGEREQRASAQRITEMQSKLRVAEEGVMAAQNHSEEKIVPYEDEVKDLHDSQSAQLQRMKAARGLLDPSKLSPAVGALYQPLSPIFAQRSPRLDITSSGLGISMSQATKTESLERKVGELEKALTDADREMEEVVGRMNKAQMEVAELQSERDEAMRQTRRLRAEMLAEREQVKALMA